MSWRTSRRSLASVLFTDIVGSTVVAADLGDRRWRELLTRHHQICRRELKRFKGREVDTAGDGFFAVFQEPGDAIRCADAMCRAVQDLGIDIRAAVHVGELEPMDGKVGGIAVHTAARILGVAGPAEILVTLTTRELVAGSSIDFADRGTRTLKGIPGRVRLFAVTHVSGQTLRAPLDPAAAAERRARIPSASVLGGRRGIAVLAAAAALMMGAAIAVLVTVGGSEAPTTQADTSGPRANDVLAIDVRTGQRVIQRTLPRGNVRAEEIEVGEGSAWLIRNPVLVKVDPGDGSFTTLGLSNAGVGIAGTSGLAVGFGKVWTFSGDTLFPVDAALFHAPQPIRIPRASGTRAIETGFGSVWLGTDSGDVLRVDPTTYHVSRIAVGEVAAPLAVGSEAVWVLDGFEGELVRVDPRSDSVVARIPFTSALDRIAIGDGVVWVLDTVAGILTGVRERDDTVSPVISLGPDTSDVAVGFGSVWVAQDGSILRIDPITMQVEERMELGDHPITRLAIDTERGRLWLDLAS